MDPRVQEACLSRDGRPGLPDPNSPYGLCGRKATLKCGISELGCVCPYGLCGRKATLKCSISEDLYESRGGHLYESRGGHPRP